MATGKRRKNETKSVAADLKKNPETVTDGTTTIDADGTEPVEESEVVYCLCRKPDDHQCDKCNEWFHGKCVGLNSAKAKFLSEWLCPACSAVEKPEPVVVIDVATKKSSDKAPSDSISQPSATQKSSKTVKPAKKLPTPPPKSVVSAKPVSLEEDIDAARKKIRENSVKLLVTAMQKASSTYDSDKLNATAIAIEAAIFDLLAEEKNGQWEAGQAYRDKARALFFNIKQASIINQLLSGDISADELVKMPAEAFETDDQKKLKLEIQEQSIRESVKVSQDALRVKKTHKGEIPLSPDSKPSDAPATTAFQSLPLPASSPMVIVENSTEATNLADNNEKKLAIINEANSGKTDAQISEDLKILSPLKRKIVSLSESEIAPAQKIAKLKDIAAVDSIKSIWSGAVSYSAVGTFQGRASQISGTIIDSDHEWKEMFLPSIEIVGRLSSSTALEYIEQQTSNPTREILMAQLLPSDKADEHGFKKMIQYFHSRQRYAVLKTQASYVKDIYMIPILAAEPLPPFMSSLLHCIDPNRSEDIFVIVILASKTMVNAISGSKTTSKERRRTVPELKPVKPTQPRPSFAVPTTALDTVPEHEPSKTTPPKPSLTVPTIAQDSVPLPQQATTGSSISSIISNLLAPAPLLVRPPDVPK